MGQAPAAAAPTREDVAPSRFVDSADAEVVAFAAEVAGTAPTPAQQASRLFEAVRDRIFYDPYRVELTPEAFMASTVLESERNWCVPKALLLTATARAMDIPARVGFADVRNHLSSPRLDALLGTDLFAFHGYTALWLDGAWRKATPAFNDTLCARFGVEPLTFDGREDALLHAYTGDGRRHMEYVRDRGIFVDLPYEQMCATFAEVYGPEAFTPTTGDTHDEAFHG